MPNWCNNNLTLRHEDPAMIKRAYDALERGEFLQEFIPVPEELKIVAGFVSDPEEQAKLEADTKANIEKFGYGNWYDFCVGEWGTKWDVGDQSCSDIHPDGTLLHTSFDSAWSPPIEAYAKLMDLGFEVSAYYYESGMAYCGVWEDGCDDFYEIGSMDSKDVAATIPQDLDDAFCISESMAEYEAENEEELTAWVKEGADKLKLETK